MKSGEVIDFKCEVPFLNPRGIQRLFVRSCYIEFADLIERSPSIRGEFIVTGTPGVGKSFFGVYMLVKLFKEGAKTIHYQSLYGDYTFSMNGDQLKAREVFYDSPSFNRLLKESSVGTWYIVDRKKPQFAKVVNTLLITSPNRSVWISFESSVALIWTLDELQQCRSLMYYNEVLEEVEEWLKWGGSSRLGLCSARKEYQYQMDFDCAIDRIDVDSFIKAIGDVDGSREDHKFSHNLLHYIVHVDNGGIVKRHGYCHLAPASSHVFDKLAAVLIENKRQEVVMFLMGGFLQRQ